MIVGLILMGVIVGVASGATALLIGSSLGTALFIYVCSGCVFVFGVGAALIIRPTKTCPSYPEHVTAH
ncbi:hypothetical protein SAMN05444358_102151 [Ruegeria halocynthiae]|uniref:Uncharacterized protein n=1 Tax=Ruegeria halocynthiae TaxID=985054 RepID=A0A1H2Y3R9_9RHOB|nr:hypothetical protein SAMN05444358_102151 [Ruegeria halocynthiae]